MRLPRLPFLAIAFLAAWLFSPFVPASYADDASVLFPEGGPVVVEVRAQERNVVGAVERAVKPVLEKMTGAEVVIKWLRDEEPMGGLLIDITGDQEARDDSYHLVTGDGQAQITAPALTGGLYGFFDLMERLGCRFWSYNEEDVPRLESVRVPKLDIRSSEPFLIHDIMSREAQTPENAFLYKSRMKSPLQFSGSHTLYPLLTPYAKEHPEIYPYIITKDRKTGEVLSEGRKPNDLHFCYLADGIAEALAAALEKVIERHKGDLRNTIYFAGMGDWYGGQCHCTRCLPVYEEEKWTDPDGRTKLGYSATLLRMINQTAQILEEKHPGIKVGTFAYMGLEAPPARTKPRDNVIIYLPRLRHCGVHPVAECDKNRSFWRNMQKWAELAPKRLYIWEYGVSYENFAHPFPVLRSMAQNIVDYHKAGVAGVMVQGNYITTGGHAVVLSNKVWSQMLRDPTQDVDKVINEVIDGYYGPLAPVARAYFKTLEDSVNGEPLIHADEFADPQKLYLTPEVKAKAKAIFAQGRRAIANQPESDWARRLEELAAGLDITEYWPAGPLGERDGKLIRLDFGHDTFPRALDLRRYSRGTTIREWGTAEAYWQDFYHRHGGPIRSVGKGALAVRAIPARRGSFGPVLVGERPAIAQSSVGTVRYGSFAETPPAGGLEMVGEGGIGSWSPAPKYRVGNRVIPQEGNRLVNEFSIELLTKDKGELAKSVPIQTDYPSVHGQENFKVEWRDGSGAWHLVKLPANHREPVNIPGVMAWRVSSPWFVVVDEYEALRANGPFDGVVGVSRATGQYYTSASFPIADLPHGTAEPWVRRQITVEPQPE